MCTYCPQPGLDGVQLCLFPPSLWSGTPGLFDPMEFFCIGVMSLAPRMGNMLPLHVLNRA